MKRKLSSFVMVLFCLPFSLLSQQTKNTSSNFSKLRAGFQTPPDSVKPSVYWYWMSDNISEKGVIKDIEAMKKVGIGRAFIGNIGYNKNEVPYGKVKLFSNDWWKITKTAITTATKHHIQIGMFNSPGWSQSGGPWIQPSQSMRYLAGEEMVVKGPSALSIPLPKVKKDFQDVALLAYPVPANEGEDISKYHPVIKTDQAFDDIQKLVDGNHTSGATITSVTDKNTHVTIDINVTDAFTARSLVLYPLEKSVRADVELQVKEGDHFNSIKKFVFDRTNPQLNVGFIPYAPIAVSFAAVKSNQYRLVLSNVSKNAGFAEIRISTAPVLERYEEKQLAKMLQTPYPIWIEYQWPTETESDDPSSLIDPAKVIDLTKNIGKDGVLHWNAPAGNWIIVRYGMLPTGVTNSPASPEGMGLEIDKINKAAMQHHFDSFVGKVQKSIPAADRKSLQWVVADSYETGSQNWTDNMTMLFKKQYGYDPLPWLPVLSGRVVGSADQSNRFLWDLRRLVADRVAYEYVGGLREVSNKHGMKLWLENYGHWGYPGEFLQYGGQSDEIGGEFWNEGELGNIECKSASSAAHMYGKNKVWAESFTAGGQAYVRYPALLKKRGDWSFTEGINSTLLHVFIDQPYDSLPGVNAGFGTEFNRNNTWFYQGKAFIDYIRRCNLLLQQGKPVNDVAYFISEDAPKMTGIRDPELPLGYSYDYINAEVLMNRVRVQNGNLVLPDGMQYKMMVLPKLETMRPELLKKIAELVKAGITILGPAPTHSPSLQNYPQADIEVKKLSNDMWGDPNNSGIKKYGKGTILSNLTMKEALDFIKLIPDVALANKEVLYTHRTTKEGEIYFLTNQTDHTVHINPEFRIIGKQPEWWDAVSGKMRTLTDFEQTNSTTAIPITLDPYQSGFVIFKNSIVAKQTKKENFPMAEKIITINSEWQVKFDAAQRGPSAPVIFKELTDWLVNKDDQIKYYSGTALYTTKFTVEKFSEGRQQLIDLGKISVMGKVTLNGIDLGTVWTPPYSVDATKAIRKGENVLEVEVVNTWVNRLIGDSKLPKEERKTWSNVNPYKPENALQSSGLLGPVTLQIVKQ